MEPGDTRVKWWSVSTLVRKININGGTNSRMADDFVSGFIPDTEGHAVSNVFGNANPVSKGFRGLGWEVGIMDLVVYRFKP